jgi:preprotein translocase subunit SecA
MEFIDKIFSSNTRAVAKYLKEIQKVNALEANIAELSDIQLRQKIQDFKDELAGKSWEEQSKRLNAIQYEVFAITRVAAKRSIGQRHFDVQAVGGLVLHSGKIAEMKTGEGKTLTATLPLVLNALTGRGAHLITVNDYLARWHASLMGPVYHLLGLSVASIQHEKSFIYDPGFEPEAEEIARIESETQGLVMDVLHMRPVSRAQAYRADITYGTNNEFGFDYLRDNMVGDLSQLRQRELHYAIVDEVDSILIDEARTPLIISAPDTDPTDKYVQYDKIVKKLSSETDYSVDLKKQTANFTDDGVEHLQKILGVENLYVDVELQTIHHLEQALRANAVDFESKLPLFGKDKKYVIQNDEVVIVDEFTGRLMFGRRYSDGLHQAIEAKEGVKIQQESKTLATITFQNYFRLYRKLAGMTGTALTEAEEFFKIYHLEAVSVPTHKPMIRVDNPDSIYKSEKGKFAAIVKDVKERYAKGQPVLIGTVSIQKNEELAESLKQAGVPFEILNAKNHEHEAAIIAQAGSFGAVTVATNIAGRGVDILLGGNPIIPEDAVKVKEAGGLYVIGTERHESRRIDNQLRGRSGRQGDPGESRFYVSVEDELMRIVGGDRLKSMMNRLGIPEDQPIEAKLVSSSIEQAQKKIEGLNFDTRKHVLEYDDIMGKQRSVIYKRRRSWLEDPKTLRDNVADYIRNEITRIIKEYVEAEENSEVEESQLPKLLETVKTFLPVDEAQSKEIEKLVNDSGGDIESSLTDYLSDIADQRYEEKEKALDQQLSQINGTVSTSAPEDSSKSVMRQLERAVALQNLDTVWMQHLDSMAYLRDSVNLRSYGQRDPLVEYKREGYDLFRQAEARIESGIARDIYRSGVQVQTQAMPVVSTPITKALAQTQDAELEVETGTVGRNDPCPCGSGRKWKKCGLINTEEHRSRMSQSIN